MGTDQPHSSALSRLSSVVVWLARERRSPVFESSPWGRGPDRSEESQRTGNLLRLRRWRRSRQHFLGDRPPATARLHSIERRPTFFDRTVAQRELPLPGICGKERVAGKSGDISCDLQYRLQVANAISTKTPRRYLSRVPFRKIPGICRRTRILQHLLNQTW